MNRIEQEEFLFDDIIYPYCQQVLSQILEVNPQIPKDEIRLLVSSSPSPNASCLGEGTIVINLGLLSRLESEGQLAFAISHELAHYTQNHVNNNIYEYVEEINSDEYKQKLNDLEKQAYGRNTKALEFLKNFTYENNRHSRYNESEADSIGLQFFLKSSYNPIDAIRLMAVLDKIDEPKYPENIDFKHHFGNLSYPYKEYWAKYTVDNDFFYSKEHILDWDSDSLKTHPKCQERLEIIAQQLAGRTSSKNSLELEEKNMALDKFRDLCDFEQIKSALYFESYGLALFHALQLLEEFPENTYLRATVGYSMSQLYLFKKEHKLSKVLAMTAPNNKENYDRFLHFVRELRLKEMGRLAFAYLEAGSELQKEDPYYLYAYILSAWISGKNEQGEILRNQYLNKFPDGIFTEEINELTFTP